MAITGHGFSVYMERIVFVIMSFFLYNRIRILEQRRFLYMEEKSNVTKLTQKDYQKKYDEKTQSVTIKYTPADMPDFDRMMKYLDRTGKSRSSFIKELINNFFLEGRDRKHTISKEEERAEYFKYSFIEEEDFERLKDILNNDEEKYNTVLDIYADNIESAVEELLEEKATPLNYWMDELEEQIENGEIDLKDDESFSRKIDDSLYHYIG